MVGRDIMDRGLVCMTMTWYLHGLHALEMSGQVGDSLALSCIEILSMSRVDLRRVVNVLY